MGIRIEQLSELDPALVRQEDEQLAEMLQEDNPAIDTKRGVLRDYLAHYGGVLGAKNQTEQTRLRQSMSVAAILADPTLADEDTVDNVASNYRVTRREGSQAAGAAVLVVSRLEAMTVATGTVFTALGQRFATVEPFTARTTSGAVVSANDRVLTPVGDGTYAFQIELVAVAAGVSSQIAKDTLLVPELPPQNFVTAYAAEDFTGGLDPDSNEELLQRFVYGMAAKAFSGRENMAAAVREQPDFAGIIADSIVGMGNEEMLRDQHAIFPGSYGGRVDWYVRTQLLYRRYGATKTATLVEKTTDNRGIWQLSFGRDEFPGFYDVQVRPVSGENRGEFAVTTDVRTADMAALATSTDNFLPDIANDIEAVYSRFQSVVIRFRDTLTSTANLALGATQDYAITVRAMPLIAELQDYALQYRTRNVMGDALVKAPVPCFLSLSFSIALRSGQSVPDLNAIANDLANLVNTYGFTGRLPASALSDVVHNSLPNHASAGAIDMFGRIRKPDGSLRYVRSTELLEVPNESSVMSTSRTVAFLLDPADVAISTYVAEIPIV